MAVYVDKSNARFGRMIMCHMMADTVDELHAMAEKLGMKREWYQAKSSPHYDLSKTRRELAVKLGAIEADNYKIVELIRHYRKLSVSNE